MLQPGDFCKWIIRIQSSDLASIAGETHTNSELSWQQHCFLAAHILGPKQISSRKIQWPLWRRPGGTNCVPLVNNCRSVCLCREACLYVAGFPCTPFSVLHGGSKLLGDKNAGQLYEVIRRLKRLCPAASCHSLSRFEYISSGTFWKKHWKCPKPVWNLGWHTGKRGWLCAGHYYDLGGLAT